MAIIHYAALSSKTNILNSLFERQDLNINLKTNDNVYLIKICLFIAHQ